jgi:hypothetical protein
VRTQSAKSGNCVAAIGLCQDGVAESEINMQSLRDGAAEQSAPRKKRIYASVRRLPGRIGLPAAMQKPPDSLSTPSFQASLGIFA